MTSWLELVSAAFERLTAGPVNQVRQETEPMGVIPITVVPQSDVPAPPGDQCGRVCEVIGAACHKHRDHHDAHRAEWDGFAYQWTTWVNDLYVAGKDA